MRLRKKGNAEISDNGSVYADNFLLHEKGNPPHYLEITIKTPEHVCRYIFQLYGIGEGNDKTRARPLAR